MRKSRVYLPLAEFRHWIFATGFLSLVVLGFSGFGDFQRVAVYKVRETNGLFNQKIPSYKITKEFDKFFEDNSKYPLVAEIHEAKTYQKMIESAMSLLLGITCLTLTIEHSKDVEAREYKEEKMAEMQKMDIDNQVAAHYKLSSEKQQIYVYDLQQELLTNPIYADLLRHRMATQENRGNDDEDSESKKEKKDVWGSLVDDDDENLNNSDSTAQILTEAQFQKIFQLNRRKKDPVPLPIAITKVTGFHQESSEFEIVKNEMIKRLANG